MDPMVLACIIEGEAGMVGPLGMMAVALTLHCRIWEHGHDMQRVMKEYYAWSSEPSPFAIALAHQVANHAWPESGLYYAMGGEIDVKARGWRDGDVVVFSGVTGMSVHLYRYDNPPFGEKGVKP